MYYFLVCVASWFSTLFLLFLSLRISGLLGTPIGVLAFLFIGAAFFIAFVFGTYEEKLEKVEEKLLKRYPKMDKRTAHKRAVFWVSFWTGLWCTSPLIFTSIVLYASIGLASTLANDVSGVLGEAQKSTTVASQYDGFTKW